ncbi:flagellar hook capping FlgD N-terminal domain-containing protein [Cohnella silvisoli]|uniref:Flagellar hook capping FlgD N-terminal domain-containing protein n=1 Tax=Cohnella silvisoli TaxID=2873699 RepID=A0ABV1KV88_9BACL|nr:flagellar hook capping FlgD N-terminal domain-containing protein [Cohnella silvisoli]MCD9023365.1 flagellar hook assembly protein FlgD [Cohnella silvisoli]
MADGTVGTSNVWPYYSPKNVQAAARKPVKELGKDEFLQILITQLRNQDPMQPLQDKEFIAQMAQFSSLEQTVNMSKEITSLRQSAGMSAGLIGKEVSWVEETQAGVVEHSGTVNSILWRDGAQYVKVDNLEVAMDKIKSISEPKAQGDPGGTANE